MNLYSTREAAAYLKMSVSALKHHIHKVKDIHPIKVGNSLAFTQEELDNFQLVRRPSGRHRKKESARV